MKIPDFILRWKNIPVISFIPRIGPLFIFMLLSNWAVLSNHLFVYFADAENPGGKTLFQLLGMVLYLPAVFSVVVFIGLLIIHLFFRKTVDRDAWSGRYAEDWELLSPADRVRFSMWLRIGLIIAAALIAAGVAKGGEVDQVARWNAAKIKPQNNIALDGLVARFQHNRPRYDAIQNMRYNGVPAVVVFCLHYRESDNNFLRHAHEGSPLTHRTRDEPKNRPPPPAQPPFTFEDSAEDAYYVYEHPTLDKINWRDKQAALDKMESFNGFGPRSRPPFAFDGVGVSSYLFSGTSLYRGGKFIRDHVYSLTAQDGQMGCVAILKRMEERGIALPF